jgi:hypothetical protein
MSIKAAIEDFATQLEKLIGDHALERARATVIGALTTLPFRNER